MSTATNPARSERLWWYTSVGEVSIGNSNGLFHCPSRYARHSAAEAPRATGSGPPARASASEAARQAPSHEPPAQRAAKSAQGGLSPASVFPYDVPRMRPVSGHHTEYGPQRRFLGLSLVLIAFGHRLPEALARCTTKAGVDGERRKRDVCDTCRWAPVGALRHVHRPGDTQGSGHNAWTAQSTSTSENTSFCR
jgi:hypothetical protein